MSQLQADTDQAQLLLDYCQRQGIDVWADPHNPTGVHMFFPPKVRMTEEWDHSITTLSPTLATLLRQQGRTKPAPRPVTVFLCRVKKGESK